MSQSKSSPVRDLQNRVLFTIFILLICRLGSFIPISGVDALAIQKLAEQNQSGILGMFNVFSGGSLERMSIFTLALVPYITASIIVQLLTIAYKPLENLKKEGESGRRKINQISRFLTVILASVQAYGIAISLLKVSNPAIGSVVVIDHKIFISMTIITLVVGTIFLMWLGEQITSRGIGNGTSLIIFTGIVSGLPSAFAVTFEMARKGTLSPFIVFSIVALVLVMIFVIVFFERAQRRVTIQYPKRQVGNKLYGGDSTYLPLKLNTAGVIPPIFASSILLFPATLVQLSSSGFLEDLHLYLNRGKPLYIFLYMIFIIFFAFFYTAVVFNPDETANNLKKYGAFVPGRRPGAHTSEYFDYVLTRITAVGVLYLSFVCLIPELISTKVQITFALGGTSMLIVVNVVLDTFAQIQTYLFSSKYEQAVKRVKIKT